METCSISALSLLHLFLSLIRLVYATNKESSQLQLPAAVHATPTPLWAVDWGPTQPLEDETHHFPSSQDTERMNPATPEAWPRRTNVLPDQTQQEPLTINVHGSIEDQERDAEEREIEEVDPQFYVTVTISSLLIFSALIISAKFCYDRSLSQRPPQRPMSSSINRSLAQEDSRTTLQSTPSFPDRERIPVVNL